MVLSRREGAAFGRLKWRIDQMEAKRENEQGHFRHSGIVFKHVSRHR